MDATGLALYGRKLWQTMSSHWPTADQQPDATPAAIEFAGRWRDMPKVVFSSTTSTVDWNTRLVTGDAVTVGGGTPFFTALDDWVNLNLVETKTFPDGVVLTRYETRR